jgi:hypothetical protein
VAAELFTRKDAGGDEAAVALAAIRLLHGLCREADGDAAIPSKGAAS